MKEHELKTWPPYFEDIVNYRKRFDVRLDDRNFQVKDRLNLREWNPRTKEYTGRQQIVEIIYKIDGGQFGIEKGYCVLGIEV